MQAASGVHDQRVEAKVARFATGLCGQPLHQRRPGGFALLVAFVDFGLNGFGDNSQLLARGGAVDVHRDQDGPMAALLEPCGQLAAGGGLARALQAGHQNYGRRLRGELETRGVLAQQIDELVAHDLDHLLGGRKRRHHLSAHGLGADVLDQVADHVEVHVGLQHGHADLAHRFLDVFFGQRALAAQIFEDTLKFVCKVFKHRSTSSVSGIR